MTNRPIHNWLKINKVLLVGTVLFSAMLFSGCGSLFQSSEPRVILHTGKGDFTVNIEVADTFDLRKRGLMFRPSLPEDRGMFFIFDREQPLNFWMKNTLITLDMVFIDANYKVINIVKNAPPCEQKECPSYSAAAKGQYVLEINGNASEKYGLAKGDKVELARN